MLVATKLRENKRNVVLISSAYLFVILKSGVENDNNHISAQQCTVHLISQLYPDETDLLSAVYTNNTMSHEAPLKLRIVGKIIHTINKLAGLRLPDANFGSMEHSWNVP